MNGGRVIALFWSNPVGIPVSTGINGRATREIRPPLNCSSPHRGGIGADCHRTWEAMYLSIVPIVKRSAMAEHFWEIGLPLMIVDDWRELLSMTERSVSPSWRSQFQCSMMT